MGLIWIILFLYPYGRNYHSNIENIFSSFICPIEKYDRSQTFYTRQRLTPQHIGTARTLWLCYSMSGWRVDCPARTCWLYAWGLRPGVRDHGVKAQFAGHRIPSPIQARQSYRLPILRYKILCLGSCEHNVRRLNYTSKNKFFDHRL